MSIEPVVPEGSFAEYFANPAVHARLLADAKRIDPFRDAMGALVRPGDWVMDLGAGTGVLSQIALELGAGRVVAIEQNPGLFCSDHRVFAEAFASGRLVLIEEISLAWPGTEFRRRIDLIVSETIGTFGINEGILPALHDASHRFLQPTGRCIPTTVGFDVLLHQPRKTRRQPEVDFHPAHWRSPNSKLASLDFALGQPHSCVWAGQASFAVPPGDWCLVIGPRAELGAGFGFDAQSAAPSFGRTVLPLPQAGLERSCSIEVRSERQSAVARIEVLTNGQYDQEFTWRFY